MKKIYIILILVLLLSGSGIAVLLWFKKKKEKAAIEKAPAEAPTIVEAPEPEPEEEKEIESKVKSEIPKELLTDISIDYVSTNKLEMGYKMQYKGVSHEGVFRHGDKATSIKKSLASFSVFTLRRRESGEIDDANQKPAVSTKGSVLNPKATYVVSKAVEIPFVYLFISNNKNKVVKGLKVNLYTGDQIDGLPKDWPEFDGLN